MRFEYIAVAAVGPLAFTLIMSHAFDEILYAVAFTAVFLVAASAALLGDEVKYVIGDLRRALLPGLAGAAALYLASLIGAAGARLAGMSWQVEEVYEVVPRDAGALVTMAVAAVGEELYWRGAVQEVALKRMGLPWWLSAVLYASGHIASGLPLLALAALAAGLILGFIAHRWGVAASTVSHFLWLVAVFYVAPLA